MRRNGESRWITSYINSQAMAVYLLLGSNEKAVQALFKVKKYFQSLQDETFDEKMLNDYIEMQRTKVPKHR